MLIGLMFCAGIKGGVQVGGLVDAPDSIAVLLHDV